MRTSRSQPRLSVPSRKRRLGPTGRPAVVRPRDGYWSLGPWPTAWAMAGAAAPANRTITVAEPTAAGSRRSRSQASRQGLRPRTAPVGAAAAPAAACPGAVTVMATRSASAQPEVGDVEVLGERRVDGVVDAAGVEQRQPLGLDGDDGGVAHDLHVGLMPEAGRGLLVLGGQRLVDQRVDLGVVVVAVVGRVGAVGAAVEQRLDDGPAVVAEPVGDPAGLGDVPHPAPGRGRVVEVLAVLVGAAAWVD